MNSPQPALTGLLKADASFWVAIRAAADDPPLALEPVLPSDLALAVAEVWRDDCLRQGFPHVAIHELPMRLLPRSRRDGDSHRSPGIDVEARLPDGRTRRRAFTVRCLSEVADRAAQSLIERGALAADHPYYYDLVTDPPASETEVMRRTACSKWIIFGARPAGHRLNY
jgi:hypothetical protein